jgi:hypothetical protein
MDLALSFPLSILLLNLAFFRPWSIVGARRRHQFCEKSSLQMMPRGRSRSDDATWKKVSVHHPLVAVAFDATTS